MRQVQVILLQKIGKLGGMGDIVNVKPGYARNHLLPKRLALRATEKERAYFEQQKEHLQALYQKQQKAAQSIATSIEGTWVSIVRQASEKGGLYGSVTSRDIATALGKGITRSQILLPQPIKEIGVFEVTVSLHAEIHVKVFVNIAPSVEEAIAQQEQYQAQKGQSQETPPPLP
ncbi:MAG: 50S ribosomal protein L9 [Holosporales bacterium]|jgi:large subunit ribosomal protein L9|nr:50S ribosomal protein L9 [Holosporales bacterium]